MESCRIWRIVNYGWGKEQIKDVSAIYIQVNNEWIPVENKLGVDEAIMLHTSNTIYLANNIPLMQWSIV